MALHTAIAHGCFDFAAVVAAAVTAARQFSDGLCYFVQIHWDAKHPTLPFEATKCEDLHAQAGGVTTQGVAIRGSKKK
jgi:hypothetical protein